MLTWERNTWRGTKRRLRDLPEESLWRGDVLRFPFNPMLGTASPPAEMMLFQAWGFEEVLGLLPLKGYKAGLPYCYFPKESQGADRLTLETAWLRENSGDWLVYEEWSEALDETVLKPMPMDEILVIRRARPAPRLIVA